MAIDADRSAHLAAVALGAVGATSGRAEYVELVRHILLLAAWDNYDPAAIAAEAVKALSDGAEGA